MEEEARKGRGSEGKGKGMEGEGNLSYFFAQSVKLELLSFLIEHALLRVRLALNRHDYLVALT